jgi:predicted RND superfamily exporter protein
VSAIAPQTSGIASTLSEHPKMIVRGFRNSTILAAVFVLVILYIGFRRGIDVAASVLPLVIGAVWMCGSMPPLGLAFNHANIVVVPLLLGLGLEASAHIVHRYRESADEHGGVAKLSEILGGTGSAVFVGTLTTVWGFTVMLFADYRAMFWLGLIMTIGKSATLFASLVVLPALLVVMKKAE